MPTPQQFQALASKLINQTFGAFRGTMVLDNAGVYDPILETETGGSTQTLDEVIRLEYDQSDFDGERIKQGDFKLIVVNQSITVPVRPDSTGLTFDGVPCHVKDAKKDPANATLTIQAREK